MLAVAGRRRRFLLLRGDDPPSYSPVNLEDDPWAYEPDREDEFEARAAAGHSHVVYAKSPGGDRRDRAPGRALARRRSSRPPTRPASTPT